MFGKESILSTFIVYLVNGVPAIVAVIVYYRIAYVYKFPLEYLSLTIMLWAPAVLGFVMPVNVNLMFWSGSITLKFSKIILLVDIVESIKP